MAGLAPAIHVLSLRSQDVDTRHKAGHDELEGAVLKMNSQMHYLPLTPGLFAVLVFMFGVLIILIQLRILRYAYMKLGVGPGMALALLFGSLIGSYFNIPITVLPGKAIQTGEVVNFYGMRYVVPYVTAWPGTVLAVNIGGAVIPLGMRLQRLFLCLDDPRRRNER